LIEAANGLLFVVVFLAEVPCGFNKYIADSCVYSPLGPHGDSISWLFSPTMIVLSRWAYHMVLLESLVVATFIDFDLRIIPDGATLPAMAVGVLGGVCLGCVYLVPVWFQDPSVRNMLAAISGQPLRPIQEGSWVPAWVTAHPHLHGLAVSLAGIVVGGGSVWIVRILGQWVLKREAMGFGDVILMAMIGSFLGWQPVLVVFFLAPLCALAVVAALWVFRRDREIPYGPYLSLGTLILILGWKQIWPGAERIFSLGPVLPVMGVLMCALLLLTLLAMQGVKRLLGIPEYIPPEEEEIWQPADQLFHFANNDGDQDQAAWRAPQWPGIVAARGSLYELRWRNAGPGRK
jgi:leader peptidase (prepilin peptidase) / N-methyltransferase